jgi:hypothetical protein
MQWALDDGEVAAGEGVDVKKTRKKGGMALCRAVGNGPLAVVRLQLDNGVDVNAKVEN